MFMYSIGSGNNPELVERVLRSRHWWAPTESDVEYNLRWQQLLPPAARYGALCSTNKRTVFNHLPGQRVLHSKLSLYQTLLKRLGTGVFDFLPITYNLSVSAEFDRFVRHYQYISKATGEAGEAGEPASLRSEYLSTPPSRNRQNLWIVKPVGLNRGRGIKIVRSPEEVEAYMKEYEEVVKARGRTGLTKSASTLLIQKYLEHPYLLDRRKFDIRCYALITSEGSGYIYEYGYLRLSSFEYDMEKTDLNVHLTNNAVQKCYGLLEDGNMLHYRDLDRKMAEDDENLPQDYFTSVLWPQMKRIMTVVLLVFSKSVLGAVNCEGCFDLYGFDFMIEMVEGPEGSTSYRPVLIEINSNPCISLESSVSWDILPRMLDDLFDLTIDRIFMPPRTSCEKLVQLMQEAKRGKRPSTSEFYTGTVTLDTIPGLRWDALDLVSPVSLRPNYFMRVMQRWSRHTGALPDESRSRSHSSSSSESSDESSSLQRLLASQTQDCDMRFRPASGFVQEMFARLAASPAFSGRRPPRAKSTARKEENSKLK
ncbi:Tubulin tyrosine ligase-like 3 [Giardia muris]|uniref:Tubulin tyrosine ligase-like 3 n=1 Tax=Giardia muris TaxID=5742 RepID=A0A4Z1SKW0_GIAMU|nr:Tubulin tyrosine ligase-like 3 [Giardia muris]|eukprot:TNJ26262.1 Tubulin tyrosine ligase-like 3 [Giardia muris]